jgi:hypothetical protein
MDEVTLDDSSAHVSLANESMKTLYSESWRKICAEQAFRMVSSLFSFYFTSEPVYYPRTGKMQCSGMIYFRYPDYERDFQAKYKDDVYFEHNGNLLGFSYILAVDFYLLSADADIDIKLTSTTRHLSQSISGCPGTPRQMWSDQCEVKPDCLSATHASWAEGKADEDNKRRRSIEPETIQSHKRRRIER